VNGIVLHPKYTSQSHTFNIKMIAVGERITTLDNPNTDTHNNIRNEIYIVQDQIHNLIVHPDYSSDILVVQGEISSTFARIDGITIRNDTTGITSLLSRVTTLESQDAINTKAIVDIKTAYVFQISEILL
jgi:hypothetical protein